MTRTYVVAKMMCNGCARAIDSQLQKVKDISYNINVEDRTVAVDFIGNVDDNKVIRAIKAAGYEAHRL